MYIRYGKDNNFKIENNGKVRRKGLLPEQNVIR